MWSVWAVVWIGMGFLILGITLWKLHLLMVVPKTGGMMNGVIKMEDEGDLISRGKWGSAGYYLSTASEWWWWRSTNDEHEQARRLLKIGQTRLKYSLDLMSLGLPAESIASVERSVMYLHRAQDKGGVIEGQWKMELAWSMEEYLKVISAMEKVVPDDLRGRLVAQQELVDMWIGKIEE